MQSLTKKQLNFTKDYLATGNATLAARKNYEVVDNNNAAVIGSQNLKNPKISATIQEALAVQGLTNDHLAYKVAELVNAKKRISFYQRGDLEIVKEELDTPAMKAGLDFAFRLKGEDLSTIKLDHNTDFSQLSEDQIQELTKQGQERGLIQKIIVVRGNC